MSQYCTIGLSPSLSLAESSLLDQVGQERQIARPLDRAGELALLLGGDRGDPARHDLAPLGNEALQQLHVLVVDLGRIRARERAGLPPPEEWTATAAACASAAGHATSPSLGAAGAAGAAGTAA